MGDIEWLTEVWLECKITIIISCKFSWIHLFIESQREKIKFTIFYIQFSSKKSTHLIFE